jgi:hypothetical protein
VGNSFHPEDAVSLLIIDDSHDVVRKEESKQNKGIVEKRVGAILALSRHKPRASNWSSKFKVKFTFRCSLGLTRLIQGELNLLITKEISYLYVLCFSTFKSEECFSGFSIKCGSVRTFTN